MTLDSLFGISKSGSTVKTEIFGGIATFLTMAYIIFVNPSILVYAVPGVAKDQALYAQYFGAFMVATIAGASIATIVMGLYANYPFALAPGMGLNAYFTYTVCMKMGIDWRVALGAIFVEGIIFIFITMVGLRAFIVQAIPKAIKISTSAGIGLFLAFIGLKSTGIITADPATFVTLGKVTSPEAITAVIGLLIIAALFSRKVPGAVMIGILGATIFGVFVGVTKFTGIIGPIPDISPTFMKLQLSPKDLLSGSFWIVVLTFFFVDFFDTAGTLSGLSNAAGFADKEGNLPRAGKAYMSDAVGTVVGSIFGSSTVTTFIESGAGIAQGARTGLASLVTGLMFLLMLFFSPLASSIPGAATAPALIFIGALMINALKEVDWDEMTEALPAFITMATMPLTYSIATGIALGMITYPAIKLLSGKGKEVHWLTWILAALFIGYLVFLR